MVHSGWRLTRGRGSGAAQLPLAICAVIAIVIVLLGKAEASIFDHARAKISDFVAPILEQVRDPLAGLERWIGGLGTIFSVYEENLRLKQENAELRRWQNAALSLERRVQRYELLLHAVANSELPSIAARVIGQSSHPFVMTMILNAGAAEGVRPGQAVLDDRGLIGRIYLAGERTSWVILLTDLNSRVPVVVAPSNHRAILAGDNTPAPELQIHELGGKVNAGDRVISSGDGGMLPPDLPVGVVVARDGELRVALFSNAERADYVHVLDYKAPVEPPPGAAAAELPATRQVVGGEGGQASEAPETMTAPNTLTGPAPLPRPAPRLAVRRADAPLDASQGFSPGDE
ncbi:MAG: rod shape-determining protein MreC [Alphaproteobacteria bacterium]